MNIVNCVSGLNGEGRVQELIEHCVYFSTISGNELTLISCSQHGPAFIESLVREAREKALSNYKDKCDASGTNPAPNMDLFKISFRTLYPKDVLELKSMMASTAKLGDGEIFIVDPKVLDVNFEVTVQEFVDTYPNADCDSSLDIYWSRERN